MSEKSLTPSETVIIEEIAKSRDPSTWERFKRYLKTSGSQLAKGLREIREMTDPFQYAGYVGEMVPHMLPGAGIHDAHQSFLSGQENLREGNYGQAAMDYLYGTADAALEMFPPTTLLPSLGIFAGPLAVKPLRGMDDAMKALDRGEDASEVWRRTGWGRNAAGQPIWEIDDSMARVDPDRMLPSGRSVSDELSALGASSMHNHQHQSIPLKDFIDHPEMMRQYPDIMNEYRVKLSHEIPKDAAAVDTSGKMLHLSPKNTDLSDPYVRSMTLHEMDHMVATQEGFPRGGGRGTDRPFDGMIYPEDYYDAHNDWYNYFFGDVKPRLDDEYGEELVGAALERHAKGRPYDLDRMIEQRLSPDMLEEYRRLDRFRHRFSVDGVSRGPNEPWEFYMRGAGETQARNVQTRMDMTPAQRRSAHPRSTEDVSRSQQWVRIDDGGGSVSYGNQRAMLNPVDLNREPVRFIIDPTEAQIRDMPNAYDYTASDGRTYIWDNPDMHEGHIEDWITSHPPDASDPDAFTVKNFYSMGPEEVAGHKVFVNPTSGQARALSEKAGHGLRYVADAEGNLYMWDAFNLSHGDVMLHYGIPDDMYGSAGFTRGTNDAVDVAKRFAADRRPRQSELDIPQPRTHATFEAQPYAGHGHLPGSVGADYQTKQAFADDPRSSWADPNGNDAIYSGAGIETPIYPMQGAYVPPDGPAEFNPGMVSHPDGATPEMLQGGEALRAYIDAQGAGAAHSVTPDVTGQSVFMQKVTPGASTPENLQQVQRMAAERGLPDVVDVNEGLTATSFYPEPKVAQGDMEKLITDLTATGRYSKATPSRVEGVYAGFEDAWKGGIGSGEVTGQLLETLDSLPEGVRKSLDNNPHIAQKALDRFSRDAEWSKQWGVTREDIQKARQIIGEGKGWIERLRREIGRGTLPAIILAPLAGYLAGEGLRGSEHDA